MENDNNSTNWTDNSGYSNIQLYPNGSYKSFVPVNDADWIIMGTIVRLKADIAVSFYYNDAVESCVLTEPALLNVLGFMVRVQGGAQLLFYDNGQLKEFTLAPQKTGFLGMTQDWQFKGKRYASGTKIRLSPNGEIL